MVRLVPVMALLGLFAAADLSARAADEGRQPPAAAGEVGADDGRGDGAADTGSWEDWLKEQLSTALEHGSLIVALLVAWLGGLLTSLMGCVYPLIPVAMAIIGTRETRSRFGALGLSATYVLGICLLYSPLGLIFAAMGKGFASWLGSPWVVGFIVLFFTAMGLSLIGLYEIRLPSALEQRLNQVGGRGYLGAFLAGLVSGLVAAPCTGPVLFAILAFISLTQNLVLGFWLLFFFALGFGTLFLVVGTFAGVMAHLPKSGSWMEAIKSGFGMILIGMALFFLRPVVPALQECVSGLPVPVLLGFGLVPIAAVTGGFHLSLHDGPVARRLRKAAGVVLGSLSIFLIAAGFSVAKNEVRWAKDLEPAVAAARSEGKPVMIDFWATWCPGCIKLDQKTYPQEKVAKELQRFVSVKIDCTRSVDDEKLQQLMERYDAMDLPTVRFIDSKGNLLEKPVIKGFIDPARMVQILREIP